MSEVALYRKYRSSHFDAVIGQPHVVDTLQNAVTNGKLSHAYLFTGPRGVGKTSVARLLARAANCTAKDPAKRPCGTCDNCKMEIGGHLDLIEIDAASNRGIDDARSLREKITSAPSMGQYKVYIIDEVHMLTTEAFNALLKTLEEPPPHAIFILATTEVHKVPETIVSRTQRFSFKPISQTDIIDHLKYIANKEKVKIDDPALALIAHASRGGFRDAISLLDQAAASGISPLTVTEVQRLLGHSDPEMLKRIVEAVERHDPAAAITTVQAALSEGVQATQLAVQLIDYWRTQLRELISAEPDAAAIEQTVAAIEGLIPVAKSSWPELALEAALVRTAIGASPVLKEAPKAVRSLAPAARKPVNVTKSQPLAQKPISSPAQPAGEVPNEDLWLKALTQIKQRNNSLYALLRSSTSIQFEGDQVILGCRFSFHRDRLKEEKNLQIIEQAITRVYGRKFKVSPQLEARQPVVATGDSSSELVSSALEILGGEVIDE